MERMTPLQALDIVDSRIIQQGIKTPADAQEVLRREILRLRKEGDWIVAPNYKGAVTAEEYDQIAREEYYESNPAVRAAADFFKAHSTQKDGAEKSHVNGEVKIPHSLIATVRTRLTALELETIHPWEAVVRVSQIEKPQPRKKTPQTEHLIAVARNLIDVLLQKVSQKTSTDGLSWKDRIEWCKTPQDFIQLFEILGILDGAWEDPAALYKSQDEEQQNGLRGLYLAIRTQFDSYENFVEWMHGRGAKKAKTSKSTTPHKAGRARTELWSAMVEKVKAFYDEHGFWPRHSSDDQEEVALGNWCLDKRVRYRKEKLSEEQITDLEAIGFCWDPEEERWRTMYEALVAFRDLNADRWPSSSSTDAEERRLGEWCEAKRGSYRKNKLDAAKIAELEAIGFDWNPNETEWIGMITRLKAFRALHPNRWPSEQSKDTEESALGNWCKGRRQAHKKKKLEAAKVKTLEEMGFSWEPQEGKWQQMYEKLITYREENTTSWPSTCAEDPEERKLGQWCSAQRQNYQKKNIKEERVVLLEEMGFEWSLTYLVEDQWQTKFEKLQEFRREHPDRWPVKGDDEEENQLCNFILVNRKNYRQNKLSAEKIAALESIGLSWNPIEDKWKENIATLRTFIRRHKRWPMQTKDSGEEDRLATWIADKKCDYRKGTLDQTKIEELEALGIEWSDKHAVWREEVEACIEPDHFLTLFRKYGIPVEKLEWRKRGWWEQVSGLPKKKGGVGTDLTGLAHIIIRQERFGSWTKFLHRMDGNEEPHFEWPDAVNQWETPQDARVFLRKIGIPNEEWRSSRWLQKVALLSKEEGGIERDLSGLSTAIRKRFGGHPIFVACMDGLLPIKGIQSAGEAQALLRSEILRLRSTGTWIIPDSKKPVSREEYDEIAKEQYYKSNPVVRAVADYLHAKKSSPTS